MKSLIFMMILMMEIFLTGASVTHKAIARIVMTQHVE